MKSKPIFEKIEERPRSRAVRLTDMESTPVKKGHALPPAINGIPGAVVTARTPEGTGEWVRVTVQVTPSAAATSEALTCRVSSPVSVSRYRSQAW